MKTTMQIQSAAIDNGFSLIDQSRPQTLTASVFKPSLISAIDRSQMYVLMSQYYSNISQEQFLKDLYEKKDVIVLRDRNGGIRGFSTLLQTDIATAQGQVRAIFSGDTVVDRAYWGQKVLGMAFLRYLFFEKVKRPFVPLYWMLMSKGYKTYLIMANNFSIHYPRHEHATPKYIQSILDQFYGAKFGSAYDSTTGLIHPDAGAGHLREGVTPVTAELCAQYPRIDFFSKANPDWAKGIELACLAEMTLFMPFYYFIKKHVSRVLKFK